MGCIRMKKRFLCLFLALVMALALVPSALAVEAEEKTVEITILHTNDIHSNYAESANDGMIGMAKIAGYSKQLKAQSKNVLLLDAGDNMHGTLLTTLYKGTTAPGVLNAVGYDYVTLGNHEFDYGANQYKKLTQMLKAETLVANIVKEGTGIPVFDMSVIRDFDGVKVGIFGLNTPETKVKAHPDNTKGIDILDPSLVAAQMVKELKAKGADYIICLAHLGIDEESEGVRSIDVAKKVKGIDLIVDGHSHSVLDGGMKVGNTLIVSAGEKGKYLGQVTITVTDGAITTNAKLLNYEAAKAFPEDAKTKKLVDRLVAKKEKATNKVIGYTDVLLDGEREHVRAGESNLARFATDVFRTVTGADVAFTNGGGIRASIQAGNITIGDVYTVFPFGNSLTVKEVTGAQLEEALAFGLSSFPTAAGAMPQVSGMTYKIKATGGKPYDIMVGGEPLEAAKKYTLVTNDFMAAGGDGYTMFGAAPTVAFFGGMEEVLINYIKENGVVFDDTPRLNVVE